MKHATLLLMLPLPLLAFNYGKIARELETTNKDAAVKKIAVLPFEDLNQSNSSLSFAVQEELTFALVRETRFTVLERSLVDRALNELQFQTTGVIDATSAKQLGKGLGAEAVVTGTIQRDKNGYRLITRLIRTDTFAILAVASDFSPTPVTQPTSVTPTPTQPTETKGTTLISALDILGGFNASTLGITYGKPIGYPLVTSSHVGLGGVAATYRMIEFDNINFSQEFPLTSLRFRSGTPEFWVGIEFSYQKLAVSQQSIKVTLDDSSSLTTVLPKDYFQLAISQLNVPILWAYNQSRFALYGGLFLGFNFANLTSRTIQFYHYPTEQFKPADSKLGFGFQGGLILGSLLHLGEHFSLLIEGRYAGLFTEWDRDGEVAGFLLSEDTTVTLSGFQLYAGPSLRW